MDPEFQPGSSRMPALARSVHFFQAGQSVMVSYLDARVMSVLTSHVWWLSYNSLPLQRRMEYCSLEIEVEVLHIDMHVSISLNLKPCLIAVTCQWKYGMGQWDSNTSCLEPAWWNQHIPHWWWTGSHCETWGNDTQELPCPSNIWAKCTLSNIRERRWACLYMGFAHLWAEASSATRWTWSSHPDCLSK